MVGTDSWLNWMKVKNKLNNFRWRDGSLHVFAHLLCHWGASTASNETHLGMVGTSSLPPSSQKPTTHANTSFGCSQHLRNECQTTSHDEEPKGKTWSVLMMSKKRYLNLWQVSELICQFGLNQKLVSEYRIDILALATSFFSFPLLD